MKYYFRYTRIILIFLLLFTIKVNGQSTYTNDDIEATVEFSKNNLGNQLVTLNLTPLRSLLIPHESCFYLDTTQKTICYFRNTSCSLFAQGIISDNVNTSFFLAKRDTTLHYEWVVPNNKSLQSFSLDIEYIIVGTKEYLHREANVHKILLDGNTGLLISRKDENKLKSRAYFNVDIK